VNALESWGGGGREEDEAEGKKSGQSKQKWTEKHTGPINDEPRIAFQLRDSGGLGAVPGSLRGVGTLKRKTNRGAALMGKGG